MPGFRPDARKKRCGAKSKTGKPCAKWAKDGADRCRKHGGTAKRGAASHAAVSSLRHGMYAQTYSDEERANAEIIRARMETAPKSVLLDQAALIAAKMLTVLKKQDSDGMVVVRRSSVQKVEAKRNDAGEVEKDARGNPVLVPVEQTQAVEKVGVVGPTTDLALKMARLMEVARAQDKDEVKVSIAFESELAKMLERLEKQLSPEEYERVLRAALAGEEGSPSEAG